jgi:phosphoribosylformylglycinamidine synthase I
MKFGIVVFPGSNCDRDMHYVLNNIYGQEVVYLWHKDTDLQKVDGIILPGGFSYGDYLRSGALAKFSPIMQEVKKFANAGNFVLGICNGFQILCEVGLLPGALLPNTNQRFICKNTNIIAVNNKTIVTSHIPNGKVLNIPIAHGEGRYYADEETIRELHINNQIVFKYCNEKGETTTESNPNGSMENIAGICNESKNVFGMMPHPERASDVELGNIDGRFIFDSIIESLS